MGHFLLFYLPNSPKNQNLKKWKKHLEISSFYLSAPKIMIICYTVPEIWCETDVIVIFHFGLFFALLPPNSPKNQNFEKMKKVPGDIIILQYVPKIMIRSCMVPGILCVTDGRTDRWTEVWMDGKSDHTEVSAHLKRGYENFPLFQVFWICPKVKIKNLKTSKINRKLSKSKMTQC